MAEPKHPAAGYSEAGHTNDILEEFVVPERRARIEEVLRNRTSALTIVLDHVRNFHNISAVLRSADAFGITRVHLVGPEHEFSSGISLGTERWIQLTKHHAAAEAVAALKSDGFQLVMLQPEGDSRGAGETIPSLPITDLPFEQKLALVFGNETNGVSPEFVQAIDLHAFIPMYGFVESLNVSVACAITLFCSTLGRSQDSRRTPPLGEEEKAMLKQAWLTKTVKNADAILREVSRRSEASQDDD